MKLRIFLGVFLFLSMPVSSTEARPRNITSEASQDCNVLWPCEGVSRSARGERVVRAMGGLGSAKNVYTRPDRAAVVSGRPAGCPYRYCGCGASLYLFGRIIPNLNLAVNWLRFPRAMPASRMVAARRGHVMVLVEHRQGSVWLVHDSNSGRGLTRLHERSISGYTIVNPHG